MRHRQALDELHQGEEQEAEQSQDEDASEEKRRVHVPVGDHQLIAQPGIAADELADHRTDDRKGDRDLEAGEDGRQRVRKADQPERVEAGRSEEHTSELQSLMRISYAVFCLNNKKTQQYTTHK